MEASDNNGRENQDNSSEVDTGANAGDMCGCAQQRCEGSGMALEDGARTVAPARATPHAQCASHNITCTADAHAQDTESASAEVCVREHLRGRLSKDGSVNVRLQELLVVDDEARVCHLVQQDRHMVVPPERTVLA